MQKKIAEIKNIPYFLPVVYIQRGVVTTLQIFSKSSHWYPVARPSGWCIGCLLWFQTQIYVCSSSITAVLYVMACYVALALVLRLNLCYLLHMLHVQHQEEDLIVITLYFFVNQYGVVAEIFQKMYASINRVVGDALVNTVIGAPPYKYGLTLTPAWMNNYMPRIVCGEINHPPQMSIVAPLKLGKVQ